MDLDPTSAEGRAGAVSWRDETEHEVRVAVNSDLFNVADVYRMAVRGCSSGKITPEQLLVS